MIKFITRYIEIFRKVFDFSKAYVFITILVKILSLLNTYVMLYINKLVLDKLCLVILSQSTDIISVIKLLVLSAFVEIAIILIFNIFQYNLGKIKLRYDDDISIQFAQSFSNLDMSYYDDSESYNQTRQAGKCRSALLDNYNGFLNVCFDVISLFTAFVITVRFSFIVTLISILSVIPAMIIRRKLKVERYNMEKELIKDQRFADYLLSMFFHKVVEMEMQLYGFNRVIVEKAKNEQKNIRQRKIQNSKIQAAGEGSLIILEKTFYIIQRLIMVAVIVKKALTIGDFSYYGGIVSNLTSSIGSVVASINNIHINNIKYDEYKSIISRRPRIDVSGTLSSDYDKIYSIEFRNVSFRYPNETQNALTNVSFKINAGEKIALVGINGAGKTTLIKLLLRFYDPYEGEILLNGVNIKKYDLASYRRNFSAMFQENLLYLLSIKDNVSISDPEFDENIIDFRVKEILKKLYLDYINEQPIDIDRMYGREFAEDGYVFSKGQQQRLQVARTLFRDTEIYILDEPAASMDAISEAHFVQAFMSQTTEKIVIYITHHYNNLHLMNRIFVFHKGIIVESGTHQDLLNKKGFYHQMYDLKKIN